MKRAAARTECSTSPSLTFRDRPLDGQNGMEQSAIGGMSLSVALRLGRISNLPTVWTNVLAGVVLSGAAITAPPTLLLVASLSLFYVAGMFLNDAFDRDFDRRNRPDRPIAAGEVAAETVFIWGFGLLASGLAGLLAVGYGTSAGTGWRALAGGMLLAATIVAYNRWHKANPFSPLLMGLCRFFVYLIAGLAVTTTLSEPLLLSATVALCYLIGLTYAAKQERLQRIEGLWPFLFLAVPFVYGVPLAAASSAALVLYLLLLGTVISALIFLFWPDGQNIQRAMTLLIASISLLDGLFIAGQKQPLLAEATVAAFALTLGFQRFIAGT